MEMVAHWRPDDMQRYGMFFRVDRSRDVKIENHQLHFAGELVVGRNSKCAGHGFFAAHLP